MFSDTIKPKKIKMPILNNQNNIVFMQKERSKERSNFVSKPLSPRIKKMLNTTAQNHKESRNITNLKHKKTSNIEMKTIKDRFKIRLNKMETKLIKNKHLSPTIVKNNITIHNLIYNQLNSTKQREGRRRNIKIVCNKNSNRRFLSPQFYPVNNQFIVTNTPTQQIAESPCITSNEAKLKAISPRVCLQPKMEIVQNKKRKKINRDIKSCDRIVPNDISTTAEDKNDDSKFNDFKVKVNIVEDPIAQNNYFAETKDCTEVNNSIQPTPAENIEVHQEVPEMVCYRKFHPVQIKKEIKRPKKLFTLKDIKKLTQTHLGRYVQDCSKNSFSEVFEDYSNLINESNNDIKDSLNSPISNIKKEEKRKKYSDFFEKLNMSEPISDSAEKDSAVNQTLLSCIDNLNENTASYED